MEMISAFAFPPNGLTGPNAVGGKFPPVAFELRQIEKYFKIWFSKGLENLKKT